MDQMCLIKVEATELYLAPLLKGHSALREINRNFSWNKHSESLVLYVQHGLS